MREREKRNEEKKRKKDDDDNNMEVEGNQLVSERKGTRKGNGGEYDMYTCKCHNYTP